MRSSTQKTEETLAGGEGILDYGSLIWVTLQRSRTAREAILMFDKLVSEYGYVSDGESFTIADQNEASTYQSHKDVSAARKMLQANNHGPLQDCQ